MISADSENWEKQNLKKKPETIAVSECPPYSLYCCCGIRMTREMHLEKQWIAMVTSNFDLSDPENWGGETSPTLKEPSTDDCLRTSVYNVFRYVCGIDKKRTFQWH